MYALLIGMDGPRRRYPYHNPHHCLRSFLDTCFTAWPTMNTLVFYTLARGYGDFWGTRAGLHTPSCGDLVVLSLPIVTSHKAQKQGNRST